MKAFTLSCMAVIFWVDVLCLVLLWHAPLFGVAALSVFIPLSYGMVQEAIRDWDRS